MNKATLTNALLAMGLLLTLSAPAFAGNGKMLPQ